MKYDILLDMLFDLLTKRKITAKYWAEKYGFSERSVYRYVDILSLSLPVQVQRGRNGGICISDTYKLPVGFMKKEEYDAAISALEIAYGQFADEKFMQAKKKLSAQMKTETRDLTLTGNIGTILVDGDGWGDTRKFSDKMHLFEDCVQNSMVVDIEYNSRKGEVSLRKIEPHVLVFKQGVWYIFAFCRKQRAFRLFHLGRIVSALVTEEKFNRKPLERKDIPLHYWSDETSEVVKLAVTENGFSDALEWLGRESLKQIDGEWFAEATLPMDDSLVKKIASFGKEIKVIEPISLQKKVKKLAESILKNY